MITQIAKRDGRLAKFDIDKIVDAIYKAAAAIGGDDRETAKELANAVAERWEHDNHDKIPTVEEIQDIVERVLSDSGHARTAKEYILYRAERTKHREMNTRLMKIYEDLTFKDAEDNDIKRENANIDGNTAMGTMLKYGSEGAKQFCQMFVMDPKFAKAHEEGEIHIHDMDFYTLTTTCCQIDIKRLFENGFSTGHGFLREPNSIHSYSALACIAVQSNQNDQHGGQSIPNFDYALALGVGKTYKKTFRNNLAKSLELLADYQDAAKAIADLLKKIEEKYNKIPKLENDDEFIELLKKELSDLVDEKTADKMLAFAESKSETETDRETFQAMEALIHNLNTMHSRAGAQIPFSSINYGMDTSPEGRMVIKNVLLATESGLGNGETPIFPIHIFKVKEGVNFNPGDPNYDMFKLACRTSGKRLFPNFSFLDAPFNKQFYKEGEPDTEVAYMGCRTRVVSNVYDASRETVFGRGNLSFTSINLPRIAIKSKGDIEQFFDELERKIELVIKQLLERFRIQCDKKVKNFPFLMGQGIWIDSEKLGLDDGIGDVLKHGTLTVGFIGLAECLTSLIGSHHGETKEAQNLGLNIIGFMRKKTDEASKKYGLNFSLIATPAEGLSGRFVRKDKKRFGIIDGVNDKEYYTNSFHIPVKYDISMYDKIMLEAPYHALTNGGHITYVEMDGDPLQNLEAFESIVRLMQKSGIGYGSINHPVDRDRLCGYTGIIGSECPGCGRNEMDDGIAFERIRRITGYLVGTLDRFNDAKRAEESDRIKHKLIIPEEK